MAVIVLEGEDITGNGGKIAMPAIRRIYDDLGRLSSQRGANNRTRDVDG